MNSHISKLLILLMFMLFIVACQKPMITSDEGAAQQLAEHILKLKEADEFSGSVLIAKDENILFQQSLGYFDRDNKTPLSRDSQFRLGSLNKMFTSIGIMMLVEDGKIQLNATIDEYLPSLNKGIAEHVTVHHLLTHTGGTGDIFGDLFNEKRLELKSHGDYVNLFEKRDLTMTPGERFQYSNFGFILLGKIIEEVSGKDYYTFLESNLFTPLGMTNTGFKPEINKPKNLTNGFMKVDGKWTNNLNTLPWRGMAAGGGYSTTNDLFKFAVALQNGSVINQSNLDLATSKQVTMGDAGYGYGMGIFGEGGSHFYGHNGGALGMSAWLSIYPNSGYIIVVLSNYDPPIADQVQSFFVERLAFD